MPQQTAQDTVQESPTHGWRRMSELAHMEHIVADVQTVGAEFHYNDQRPLEVRKSTPCWAWVYGSFISRISVKLQTKVETHIIRQVIAIVT